MPERTLTNRQLNRTHLHRQHLLERSSGRTGNMLRDLVGLQGQVTNDPYLALWSRVEGFVHDDLSTMLLDRSAVRASLMRGTIHVVTADDYREIFPATLPLHQHTLPQLASGRLVPAEIVADAMERSRELLRGDPQTTADLASKLASEWPNVDPRGLGQVSRFLLPLIQATPRGVWGATGGPIWSLADEWLDADVPEEPTPPPPLIRRYLAAFGPASVADMTAWSGLRRLAPIVKAMREELVSYRDDCGVELLDLPGAPILGGDESAPVRFLPGFDNALLGHKDRRRIIAEEHRRAISAKNGLFASTFLVDGFVAGTWKVVDEAMQLMAFGTLAARERKAVEREASLVSQFCTERELPVEWV